MDKQTGKLIARIAENLPNMNKDVMQGWIENPTALGKFLSGLNPPKVVVPVPESPLDFIIRVDREVRPAYPDWVRKVMHPELEHTGPTEYNLETEVEEWLHDDQKTGIVRGQMIYDHLKASNKLADQLGLVDLLAIQAKGMKVFHRFFAGKTVFGWKSVVRYRGVIFGSLDVPYLYEFGGRVVLGWHWLDSDWYSFDPALRFASASSPLG